MSSEELMECLAVYEKDRRLNVWHLALLIAVLRCAYRQREGPVIRVSRSRIMEMSHVNTLPTYHKYFKELQDMGYIRYRPSYHPGYRSEVELLIKP